MKTKHLPLIVGISLPVIFIIVISIVVFDPSLSVKPQHDFIYYTVNENYYDYNRVYANNYKIENGRLALEPVPNADKTASTKIAPVLYLYDVKNNSSHQITFDEAQKYILDPGPSSPDGYIVEYKYNHDGIFELFGSNDSNKGYFVSKGNAKKKLNIVQVVNYYNSAAFKFIGWIK